MVAAGSNLAYQWQRSTDGGTGWGAIPGATAASYTLAAVDVSMNGQQFRVVVTGAGGSVTSSAVTLSVTAAVAAPAIGVQPAAQVATAGGSASFAVTASGTALAYQWQDSRDGGTTWSAIAGATAATLTLQPLTLADDGRQLRVVVSNSAGSVPSTAVTLTVNPTTAAPTITAQPPSVSVTAPQTANFTVLASGTPAPGCQWQQSANGGSTWAAIGGATSCSYTTPATSTADSGRQFRAVVSNSAGSVASAAATLTVAAAPVAPTISTQPQSASVTVPATATFTVAATGTPTPAYQWQVSTDAGVTFVNINGATTASYTTPATATGDNGRRYRVVVSNTAGTLNSGAAVLTVNAAAVSPLAGRSWRTGQLLVAGDAAIGNVKSVIDDAGNVTVAYTKSNGTRTVRYAVRGTPNALGTAPAWSVPVALDLADDAAAAAALQYWAPSVQAVAAAPAGDVAVLWDRAVACDATSYLTTGGCVASYLSRYRAATATWEAPVPVPGLLPGTAANGVSINDQGDLLVLGSGWVRSAGSPGYTAKDALFMRAAGEATFRQQLLQDSNVRSFQLRMDNRGELLMAASYTQGGPADIVVFRGNVASGLTLTPTTLDTRVAVATLILAEVGLNGQQAVVWSQDNGVRETTYAAIASSSSAAFAVADTGENLQPPSACGGCSRLFVTDTGDVLIYDLYGQSRVSWSAAAGWGSVQSINGLAALGRRVGFSRRGDFVQLTTSGSSGINDIGYTKAYDAARNVLLPDPGYVLGTATQDDFSNTYFYLYASAYPDPLVSVGGIAFQSILWGFSALPTPAQPAGRASAVNNLWGVYLK
jgi:hypothetical protein